MWPEHGLENNIVVTAIESSAGEVLVPCDHWGTFDLPSPPLLRGDQSVVAHAPSFAQIANQSAWHRAPPGGGAYGPATASNAANCFSRLRRYNHTGIHHSSIVQLKCAGCFGAIGREQSIQGSMPFSCSNDGGYTWVMRPTPFEPPHGGQRPVMRRLGSLDQPLLLCSFANAPLAIACGVEGSTCEFEITGLFCALSQDDGACCACL